MAQAKRYRNYIGGKWVVPVGGKYSKNTNPANNALIGSFPRSDSKDINMAVASAKKAFKKWRQFPAPERAEILFTAAEMLKQKKESLARDMTREMGKVISEARGDVQEAIDMTYYIAGEGRRLFGFTTPSELRSKTMYSIRQPLGVVGVITPWNFPVAIPSWKIVPALVAGNAVVFKPATDTPLSAFNFVKIFEEAGLPAGTLNLVFGSGSTAGKALVEHRDVSLISFTGSSETGKEIAVKCALQHKRVSMEMGGKNAMIVMPDANLDLAVEGALWGAFGTTGQRCTATSRIIVHKDIAKKFTDAFCRKVKKLSLGNGLDRKTDVGPLINQKQREKVAGYVAIGKNEGAKLLCGGKIPSKQKLKKGSFFEPTIFTNVKPEMRIAQEEIFGPVVGIINAGSLDEAIKIANSTDYGLSAAIYTKNVNDAMHAVQELYTGVVYVNAPTIGAEVHLPFGGTKNTGNGHREAGHAALDVFTEWKAVYIDSSDRLQKAQIDD